MKWEPMNLSAGQKNNAEVMMAVNLGTRGADAARNLLECLHCLPASGNMWP